MKIIFLCSFLLLHSISHAGTFTIDDFSIDQGPVSDFTLNDGGVTSKINKRSLSIEAISSLPPLENSAQVTLGHLDMINGAGDKTKVSTSWDIGKVIPDDSTYVQLDLKVVELDGNSADISFTFNNVNLGNFSIDGPVIDKILLLSIDPNLLKNPGILTMEINGTPAWDMAIDEIGFTFNSASPVPEPATALLLGSGFLFISFLKKRMGR